MSSIALEGISKVYPNGFQAVTNLHLQVNEGEFMVLVGPSGCGKTTALRMVAGLEDISSGVLRIGDQVANTLTSKERDIAMVFQNYALYPHMTVGENIAFGLSLRKMPKAEIDQKVAAAAEILGLTDLLKRKPALLSGGQRQRVAMGRAIVRNPSVFLMDEPLSNLDAKLRVQMRTEVHRIQRRIGVATLYVTHDQTEAMTMGDRVAVMRGGVLQQCAAPQEIYAHPTNVFVAAFIGSPSMNLYQGQLSEDGTSLTLGTQTIALSDVVDQLRPSLRQYRGRSLIVGIRPEDLPLASEASPARLEAVVEAVEALGSELLVHFAIDAARVSGEGKETDALDGTGSGIARVEPRAAVQVDRPVTLGVYPERLHFFDADSHEAIR
jgi:multiple sugar transport system ATP-binding protein